MNNAPTIYRPAGPLSPAEAARLAALRTRRPVAAVARLGVAALGFPAGTLVACHPVNPA